MAATGAASAAQDHVIIFPFMAKGHTIPLLHLAAALSLRGLRVSLITTPANAPFICRRLPAARHPLVAVHSLPFPLLPPLPPGVESTDALPSHDLYPAFIHATALLADPFDSLFRHLVHGAAAPPLCLISDFFLWWTFAPCRELSLPRLAFQGTSAFSTSLCRSLGLHRPFDDGAATFHVPGTPPSLLLTQADVPEEIRNLNNPAAPSNTFVHEMIISQVSSWGLLVNSLAEIEGSHYVELLESAHRPGFRTWLLGPLCLFPAATDDDSDSELDPDGCLRWLDKKPRNSVVYVSFGTQALLSDEQLDELAHGLAESGHEFLLITRSSSWQAPLDAASRGSKVVHGWAPQGAVLRHPAVGGFVSHCGWNSVLESLTAGVPILAWPMMAEQPLNALLVADVLGAAVRLGARKPGEAVMREEVAEGVREVMGSGGERGRRARERVTELQRAAAEAVAEGGSSEVALQELLLKLREVRVGGERAVFADDMAGQ